MNKRAKLLKKFGYLMDWHRTRYGSSEDFYNEFVGRLIDFCPTTAIENALSKWDLRKLKNKDRMKEGK